MSQNAMSDSSNSGRFDLVIDEILDALRDGKSPSMEDFVARFPLYASEIRDVFPALAMAEQIKQDSIVRMSSARSSPKKKSTEHDLLLGVIALQCGLISRKQFVETFEKWNANRDLSFQSILVAENLILNEACDLLHHLADQQLYEADKLNVHTGDEDGTEKTHFFGGSTKPPSSEATSDFDIREDGPTSPRFEFVRPLDRGGLGIVSVALDKALNREVALKEIRDDRSDDPVLRQKFLLEAQLTGGLEHPGIIPIYGLGKSAKGKPYYAMRLIKGNNLHLHVKSFHERVKLGKTEFDGQSLKRILRRFMDVCDAISYAHSRGVLHRDLKPGNIMLGPYGETLVVDWGLAKAMGVSSVSDSQHQPDQSIVNPPETPIKPSGSQEDETRHGSIVGTPAYAPPEQLSGHLQLIGVRSDVYGLGAILYEILCGQAPASGSLLEVIRTITTGKVPSASKINPTVPKSLDAICQKAMALSPEDRFESANELRNEVERWLDDAPVNSCPDTWWIRGRRWVRKHPSLASTLSAVVLMSLVGMGFFTWIVTKNNAALESLNITLDNKNTELTSANQELADLNSQLDSTNSELLASISREKQAKEIAQQQSELALSTLNAVVLDIQNGLKAVPGGASIRRRLLATSLIKLENVATNVVSQSTSDRSTLKALLDLGEIVLQFGTDSNAPLPGRMTTNKIATNEGKSAAKIAQNAFERANEIAKSLVSDSSDEQTKYDLLASCLALGNLNMRLGESDTAASYFSECLTVSETLVESSPENLRYQQKRAYFKLRYAEFLTKTNRLDDALRLYQSALSDYRRLIQLEPENQELEGEVCIVLEYLGEALVTNGQVQSAAEAFAECLNQRQKRYDAIPMNTVRRRDLIIILGKQGENQLRLGQLEEAIETADRTLAMHREITAQDALDIQSQADLANTLDRRATLSTRQGNSDEAIQFMTEAMEIRKRLAARDPLDSIRQRDLSLSYDNIGKLETKRGNLERALELTQASLGIARELAKNDPRNTMKQRDVGLSLISVGKILLQQGKSEQAMELYQESLELVKQLAEADPENPTKQRDLLIGISRVADVHAAENRLDPALASYQQGLALARQSSDKSPEVLELKRDLSIWLELVADILKRQGKSADALGPFQECLAIREALLKQSPDDVRNKLDVAAAMDNVGTIFGQLGRFEESAEQLSRAVELTGSVAKSDPNNGDIQRDLIIAKMRLGITRTFQEKYSDAIRELRESQSLAAAMMRSNSTSFECSKDWMEVTKSLRNTLAAAGEEEAAKQEWESCVAVLKAMIESERNVEWATQELDAITAEIDAHPSSS